MQGNTNDFMFVAELLSQGLQSALRSVRCGDTGCPARPLTNGEKAFLKERKEALKKEEFNVSVTAVHRWTWRTPYA